MAYDPEQVARYYADFFAARTDVYSAWTPDGWRPVRKPLTPQVVLDGLTKQGPSVSGYLIAPGSISHVAAIDYDIPTGFPAAAAMARTMQTASIPAYVEPSRRGAHLWCVLDRQVPAKPLRMALRALLQAAGPDLAHDPKVEIRPGSDTVADDGLGHALRLPLMPHPKTGLHFKLFDADGMIIGSKLSEVLLAFEMASADRLLAWAERYVPPPLTSLPPTHRPPHEPFPEDTSTASDVLREFWGVLNAAPGRSVRCPAHPDKAPSLSILKDDRRAICKVGYCPLNNEDRGRGTYELRMMAPHA